jgi:hypothetical protein
MEKLARNSAMMKLPLQFRGSNGQAMVKAFV